MLLNVVHVRCEQCLQISLNMKYILKIELMALF